MALRSRPIMLVLPVIHKATIALALAASMFDTIVVAPPSPPSHSILNADVVDRRDQTHLVYPSYSPLHSPVSTSSWLSSSKSVSGSTKTKAASKTFIDIALPSSILPNFLRRYNTANDIPPSYYTKHNVLRGRVVRVIDGDTIRIRHTPLLYSFFSSDREGRNIDGCSQKKTSECTISVRLYGVDAPETSKFGNPGQPFSQEAKDFLYAQLYNKMVKVKLLSKDQYSRVVGSVTSTTREPRSKFLPFLTKKEESDWSLKLIERGYATLYTGGGAQYNDRREELIRKMEHAKKNKLGVWSIQHINDGDGGEEYVDPAAYKRAMKARMKTGR